MQNAKDWEKKKKNTKKQTKKPVPTFWFLNTVDKEISI